MAKRLYFDCSSGISGDMFCAAMIDLGVDEKKLLSALDSMHLSGCSVAVTRKLSYGMEGCSFDVELHHHHHHEEDEHNEHHHHHEHRNLSDVLSVIAKGNFKDSVKSIAEKIFRQVAESEASVHGKSLEEVHFHEVGAVDSIIDTVAAAFCIDFLGVCDDAVIPRLCEGRGFINCQHGRLPVPVPAVLEMAKKNSIPLHVREDADGELVTPTGAAIASVLGCGRKLPENFTVVKTGIGVGKRDFGFPNVLRAMIIDDGVPSPDEAPESVMVLETNVDDTTGEELGLAMEKLFECGALDVHYVPCFMKKNRPAWLLRVICRVEDAAELEKIIFSTTRTIGIRRCVMNRTCLEREMVKAVLPYGDVDVKKCYLPSGEAVFYPEYESVRLVSDKSGRSFKRVYDDAVRSFLS